MMDRSSTKYFQLGFDGGKFKSNFLFSNSSGQNYFFIHTFFIYSSIYLVLFFWILIPRWQWNIQVVYTEKQIMEKTMPIGKLHYEKFLKNKTNG